MDWPGIEPGVRQWVTAWSVAWPGTHMASFQTIMVVPTAIVTSTELSKLLLYWWLVTTFWNEYQKYELKLLVQGFPISRMSLFFGNSTNFTSGSRNKCPIFFMGSSNSLVQFLASAVTSKPLQEGSRPSEMSGSAKSRCLGPLRNRFFATSQLAGGVWIHLQYL